MKKLPLLFTTALLGLSINSFAQTTTSYSTNNDNLLGRNSVFIGFQAGSKNTSDAFFNVFTGSQAGSNNTEGTANVFTGAQAGLNNTEGRNNIFTGYQAGLNNTIGIDNVFTGAQAGRNNTTGNDNAFIGRSAGRNNETGKNNVFIGRGAGFLNTTGSGSIFIGKDVGFNETSSNKLYIDNSSISTPLIYGDFSANELTFNGKVSTGVGNTSFPTTIDGINISDYTLFVQGGLLSEEVRVRTDWADYVFNDTYELKSLNEVESFINDNGHLPNVPSAKEVEASGIEMGEITKIQQEKIEELTLYLIAMDKRVKLIEQENIRLQKELVELNK